jgi:hypothetical protein
MARKKPSRKKSESRALSRSSSKKMLKNLERLGVAQDVLINPPDQEKMSEVLLDFARPLLDLSDEDEHFDKVIALAAASWNVALLPPVKQEASLEGLIDIISSSGTRDDVQMARETVRMLLERKKRYFPDNKRFIADYQISNSRSRRNLLVASTLPSPNEQP